MLGDMMKQMEEMQAQMQKQLAEQTFEGEAGGAVKVTCDGARTIQNVSIDPESVDPTDLEALEDLFVVATNRALEKAAAYEAEQAGGMMNNMLPGGLGSMFGG